MNDDIMLTPLVEMATQYNELYLAFLESGFSESQAHAFCVSAYGVHTMMSYYVAR